MSLILAAAEGAEHAEPAIHPYLVGALVLASFLILMLILLVFGKGREHS